ncbi:glycosyltransferase [Candidatus Latescibacterota bacterium]
MPVPSSEPTVSIIIPVHNGGEQFRKCLKSLEASEPLYDEIIVVTDEETDDSQRLAEAFDIGIKIVKPPAQGGPAKARNLGARTAKGSILFFIDADVMIRRDTIGRVIAAFRNDPDLDALFGSYDDNPAELNFLSQYKNLFHHYVHQRANENSHSFWSGCGAIRRDVFLKVGGFNEHFDHPSIEDIALGYRLRRKGFRTHLVKDLQVTHLKRWDAVSLLKTDVFDRALPWTYLILRYGRFINDLNLKVSDRISVFLLYASIAALLGGYFITWLLAPAGLGLCALFILNVNLYRFFKKKRGLLFMIMVIPWHWLYLFYCGLAFSWGLAGYTVKKYLFKERW